MLRPHPSSTPFPYTTLFRSYRGDGALVLAHDDAEAELLRARQAWQLAAGLTVERLDGAALRALEPALGAATRSEEHTSELQPHSDFVFRLLLEKKIGCSRKK